MSRVRLFDRNMNDSLEHMFRRLIGNMRIDPGMDLTDIRVDLLEKNGSYKLMADMPGIKKEDINVRVEGNTVQIDAQAQSPHETEGDGEKLLHSERANGHLSRLFTLAQEVEEGKVTAKFSDGVLQLNLPKKTHAVASAKPIKIQ